MCGGTFEEILRSWMEDYNEMGDVCWWMLCGGGSGRKGFVWWVGGGRYVMMVVDRYM